MTNANEKESILSHEVTIPGAQQLHGKRVAIVGLGKSGTASIEALTQHTSAHVSAWDASASSRESALTQIGKTDLEGGAYQDQDELASHVLAWHPDLIVIAPGISELSPLFSSAQAQGIDVVSEIELAWRLRAFHDGVAAAWLCVTGTNGKTTTTTMLASMLTQAGFEAAAIGNVGTPAVTLASCIDPSGRANAPRAFAVELSSFQLASTFSLQPLGAVCLNVADDHLEWHGSRQAYRQAKARVYEGTEKSCVYPVGNAIVQAMVDNADVQEGARAIGITLGAPMVGQIGMVDTMVIDRAYGASRFTEGIELFDMADLAHLAPEGSQMPLHIVWDAMAAAALARAADVSPEDIRRALRAFEGGRHRIESVATINGIRYVNDSKATNAHAARASLGSLADGSVVWIVGGLAKGASFNDVVSQVSRKLRAVVVIGTDQAVWREALARVDVPVHYVSECSSNPMKDAVRAASAVAKDGDTVLLAPACASMDQFSSYAQRGDAFVMAVEELRV